MTPHAKDLITVALFVGAACLAMVLREREIAISLFGVAGGFATAARREATQHVAPQQISGPVPLPLPAPPKGVDP